MNDWMEPYLRECIGTLPDSVYRDQVSKELTDHLEMLAETFEAGGSTLEEARRQALGRMGDPKELSRTFRKEFRRRHPAYWVETFLCGSFLAGGMYVVAFLVMGLLLSFRNVGPVIPIGYLADRVPHDLLDGVLRGIYGCGMFLLPFWLETRYLMRKSRFAHRRRAIVTCGLWVTWAGEKTAILLLGYAVYRIRDISALAAAVCYKDGLAPWFTAPYILLTFIGCPILVFLASKFEKRVAARRESPA